MKALTERISGDDALGVARLVRRMSGALSRGAIAMMASEWESSDDALAACRTACRSLPVAVETRRPYFETLFVSAAPAANYPQIAQEIRRLRRVEDPMIYEPVLSAASKTRSWAPS